MSCWPKVDEDSPSRQLATRNITDATCLFFFSLFWCFMLVVAVFSFTFGDPSRLAHGYDSFGNVCGSDNNKSVGGLEFSGLDLSDRPFVYYLNAFDLTNSLQLCVKSCPDKLISNLSALMQYEIKSGNQLCRYEYDVRQCIEDTKHGLNESLLCNSPFGPCPVLPIVPTTNVLNRCIPDEYPGTIHDVLSRDDVGQLLLLDIYNSWPVIGGFLFCAFIASCTLMALFFLSTIMASFLVLICSIAISVGGVTLLWWSYCGIMSYEPRFDCCQSEVALLVSCIAATILGIIVLAAAAYLVMALFKGGMSFFHPMVEESSAVLKSLPALCLQPLLTFIALTGFYIFWILVMSYLTSARYPHSHSVRPRYDTAINSSSMNPAHLIKRNVSFEKVKRFTQVEYIESPWMRQTWWICVFGLVWVSEFVLACQQSIIGTSVAKWYFNGRTSGDKDPAWVSFRYLVLYHLGSAALGSFLISIFKIPRLIMSVFYRRYLTKNENCKRTPNCCFDCYENFVAYISRVAYTIVGMSGVPFLTGGKRAWIIRTRSKLSIPPENNHSNIMMFLAKSFVTASVGSISFMFFNSTEGTYSAILPTVLVCVCSFFIAHCVISVFELIVDTLYLCICEDQDINPDDGIWSQSPLIQQDVKDQLLNCKPSSSNMAQDVME